jgi:hypothetical protein
MSAGDDFARNLAGAAETGASAEEVAAAAAKRKEANKEAIRAEVCGKFTGDAHVPKHTTVGARGREPAQAQDPH